MQPMCQHPSLETKCVTTATHPACLGLRPRILSLQISLAQPAAHCSVTAPVWQTLRSLECHDPRSWWRDLHRWPQGHVCASYSEPTRHGCRKESWELCLGNRTHQSWRHWGQLVGASVCSEPCSRKWILQVPRSPVGVHRAPPFTAGAWARADMGPTQESPSSNLILPTYHHRHDRHVNVMGFLEYFRAQITAPPSLGILPFLFLSLLPKCFPFLCS